jgi:hypothetical protein
MHGNVAVVMFRQAFDPSASGDLDRFLRSHCANVRDSRKGRYWEFELEQCDITLLVEPTQKSPWEYEDYILQLDLDFNDVPEAAIISASRGGPEMRERLTRFAESLARQLNGISLGAID